MNPNPLNELIDLANAVPVRLPRQTPPRTIKVYNHPDPSDPTGVRLLPVRRRVSKQEARGGQGVSARQAKRQRMKDLRELTKGK